jgi:hypothetical protein
VGKTLQALNIFGAVSLLALALYIGWAVVAGTDEHKSVMAVRAATTPASR